MKWACVPLKILIFDCIKTCKFINTIDEIIMGCEFNILK